MFNSDLSLGLLCSLFWLKLPLYYTITELEGELYYHQLIRHSFTLTVFFLLKLTTQGSCTAHDLLRTKSGFFQWCSAGQIALKQSQQLLERPPGWEKSKLKLLEKVSRQRIASPPYTDRIMDGLKMVKSCWFSAGLRALSLRKSNRFFNIRIKNSKWMEKFLCWHIVLWWGSFFGTMLLSAVGVEVEGNCLKDPDYTWPL